MQNSFCCNKPYINLYESGSLKSKISSQILYGEKFKILGKKKKFLKIKTQYDNYIGYIKLSKFTYPKIIPLSVEFIIKSIPPYKPEAFSSSKIILSSASWHHSSFSQ